MIGRQYGSPPPLLTSGDVFIVGAGFSKAIDVEMPTLDELGHRILEPFTTKPSFNLLPAGSISAINRGVLPAGSFEAWLSSLASPAPFVERSEQLHNEAIAAELIKLVVGEIARSEAIAIADPSPPYWLNRLVTLWDRLGATVITFNYDTLVEQAVNASRLPWVLDANYDGDFGDGVGVFDLLKMHGSTNWWWVPGDKVGATFEKSAFGGRWGKPTAAEPMRGREPFVIPPVAVKSDYYDVSMTREDWLAARTALEAAKRVILLGYSAPATDLTVASLLSGYAAPDVPYVVVDTAPQEVVSRLRRFGLADVTLFEADDPIPAFAGAHELEASRKVATSLVPLLDGIQVYEGDAVIARVKGTTGANFPITDVTTSGDTTAFVATDWEPEGARSVAGTAINGKRLRDELEDAARTRRRVIVKVPNQPDRVVLNIAHRIIYGRYLAIES